MQRLLSTLQKFIPSQASDYSKKLNFHFISFEPFIIKYLDLHFVLNENLEPGLEENSEFFDNLRIDKFKKEMEDEEEKKSLLKDLEDSGLSRPEFDEEDHDHTLLMSNGRMYDFRKNYKKIFIRQFLLSSKNLFEKSSQVENLLIVPDIECPREIVPCSVWASFKDKMKALEKIKLCSRYFYELIPEVVENDHKVLAKFKYGDFPTERFLYEPEFDYFKKPVTEKKSQIDEKIKELPLSKVQILQKLKKFVENIEKNVVFGRKKVYSKSFLFVGSDVEGFVEEIGKFSGFKAGFDVMKTGEVVIQVFYKMKNCIELSDVEKLNRKYGKEILAGITEIDVDEEDQASMMKLLKMDKKPAEILQQYLKEKNT